MRYRTIDDFRFFFNNETVIMRYRDQYTCFHAYDCRNKDPLRKFGRQVMKSRTMKMEKVFELARKCGVGSMHTTGSSTQETPNLNPKLNKSRILW